MHSVDNKLLKKYYHMFQSHDFMPSFDNLNSKQLVGPEVQTKSRKSKYSRKGPRYVLYSTVTKSDNTKRKVIN